MPATARFLASALALCTGRAAFADRNLTLDEALALARSNNRDLRVGRARLASAEAGIAQARAALMPTLTAQGKYTHNYKEVDLDISEFTAPTLGLANAIAATATGAEQAAVQTFVNQANAQIAAQAPIVIQKEEQLDGGVNANLPLLAPSAWYGYASAKSSARSGEASYAVTETSVLLGVAQAFYAAAGADELVVARTDAVQVADDTFKYAKARVGSDLANPVDIMRAEAALVRAQQDLVEAQNTRATAYRSLATLLGTREPLHVQPSNVPPQDPGSLTTDQLVPHALAWRPELAAERAAADAATDSSRANAWKWAPTLSAFGNAHLFNYTGFSGDKYSWALGLELDWVLYDGGLRDAQRAIADAQADEARAQLDLLHDSISDEVANARGTLDTKHKAVDSATRSRELASETLRLTRAQYEAGTSNQLDVLQAQDSLVAAEVALAQAHFDVSLADLQLRRAAGEFPGGPK
jgi:outer membrane protein TolC